MMETAADYFETYERDWKLAGEQRLSEVDMTKRNP